MLDPLQPALQALYLFAPLLFASLLAGIVQRYDWFGALRRPLDAGKMFRGERIFGDSKTWRGVVIAAVGCILGAALQKHVVAFRAETVALVAYAELNPIAFGAAMGCGAMLGELPNSFVKRRLRIAPGATTTGWQSIAFYVWDQVDMMTCAWPAIAWWVHPEPAVVVASFAVSLLVHPLVSLLGYLIGARSSPR